MNKSIKNTKNGLLLPSPLWRKCAPLSTAYRAPLALGPPALAQTQHTDEPYFVPYFVNHTLFEINSARSDRQRCRYSPRTGERYGKVWKGIAHRRLAKRAPRAPAPAASEPAGRLCRPGPAGQSLQSQKTTPRPLPAPP